MSDKTNDLPEDLLDMKQAARLAKCHLASMYRYVFSGKLRGFKRVGRWFVSAADVKALFHRHQPASERERERREAQAKELTERQRFTEAMMRDMGYRK
jgi:hypothetical protein